jgi:hypothetical protein
VTGRHEAPLSAPRSVWLEDQLRAWESAFVAYAELAESHFQRNGSKSTEVLLRELIERDRLKSELLATARTLIDEVLRGAEPPDYQHPDE